MDWRYGSCSRALSSNPSETKKKKKKNALVVPVLLMVLSNFK
jgi:hypothetical protein